ncbi:hypothetical protein ID866_9445 [Astraeus odoratus]|nr:hypothetical protein ID866_9445 [Astraeus odoratus]
MQLKGFKRQKKNEKDDQEKEKGREVNTESGKQLAPPVSFGELFRYSTPFDLTLDAIGIICAMATGAAQPLMTLLFGRLAQDFVTFTTAVYLFNDAMLSGNATAVSEAQQNLDSASALLRKDATLNASYLAYMGIGAFVCTYVYMVTWIYTGEINTKRIREKYLQAVLRQDIKYFDGVGAGEVATRIQTDTHLVQTGISEKVALVVNHITAFFTGFVLAYTQCWQLALAVSAIIPETSQAVAESGTLAEEVISTIRTAHSFGLQRVLGGLFDKKMDRIRLTDSRAAVWGGCGLAVLWFILYSVYPLAFDFGTTLINEGHATAGQVVNTFLAILVGSISLAMIAPEMQAITSACGAAAELYATIERVPDIDSANPGGVKLDRVVGEITLEDVQFNYPARPDVPILRGINITFEAGKTAALVGASGSGKSTIVALVERFYDPDSGSIRLDGVELQDLNIKWLRSNIGLVSQEPTLFAATIKENVAHGLIGTPYQNISEDEKSRLIKDACIQSNADDFICRLPHRYDTMIGERGFLLSGGQKQRIAIARAIVSNPRVLLLDEATSALDSQSEGVVQDALDRASAGRTTIAIAHRLSTIKDADQIFVIGDGVVLEQGRHEELVARKGPYALLVQAQKLREDENGQIATVANKEPSMANVRLDRRDTHLSATSNITHPKNDEGKKTKGGGDDYSLFYLFNRIGELNREVLHFYVIGAMFAIVTGMVYPVLAIIYGKTITSLSQPDPSVRRHEGDLNALW